MFVDSCVTAFAVVAMVRTSVRCNAFIMFDRIYNFFSLVRRQHGGIRLLVI